MGKESKILSVLSVILVFALAIIFGYQKFQKPEIPSGDSLSEETLLYEKGQGVELVIDFGSESSLTFADVAVDGSQSLFDVLDTLSREGNISLDYKDYGGDLGIFVTAINDVGLNDKENRWWQYWINDIYGEDGMSNLVLVPGDKILLKFSEGEL